MTNRFLVSVAALALIAGTGLANAQGTAGREPGGAQMQSQPSSTNAPGARSQGQANERNAETRQDRSHTTTGQGGGPANMNRNPRAEENAPGARSQGQADERNAETRQDRSHMTTGQAGAGAKLSTDQRSRITTIIRNERVAPVNNVGFAVSVGTRVPREHVSLRPLPVEVVNIYPQWHGYEFFVVRDQIVVVDPRSLEIVAILEA
jgi:hypothetical protein